MPADHCCDEYRCQRKKPILIRQGDLTARWYAVTAYETRTSERGSYIVATTKHDITDELVAQLTAAGWTAPGEKDAAPAPAIEADPEWIDVGP